MATADKLTTVAQNVPKVYHAGQMNMIENAECLKGSKTNTAILLDDVSPVTHEMGVKVRGKNLFDKSMPYEDYTAGTGGYRSLSIYVGSGSTVTVSLKQKHDIGLGGYFYCVTAGSPQMWLYHNSNISLCNKSVTLISEDSYISLIMTVGAYNNFKDEIMVEIGTTATAYTPYVSDLTEVKVSRCGKNLFSGLTKGVGINSNDGSEITNSNYSVSDYIPVDFNTNTNYYISGLPTTISNYIAAYNANKEFLGRTGGNAFAERRLTKTQFPNGTPQGTGDIAYLRVSCFKISTSAGTVDDIDDCNIQLEVGSTATDYEPYNSAEYTANADGTVEGVTSLYPVTQIMTDTDGVIIYCNYYKDVDKAFDELTTSVALSGGDS